MPGRTQRRVGTGFPPNTHLGTTGLERGRLPPRLCSHVPGVGPRMSPQRSLQHHGRKPLSCQGRSPVLELAVHLAPFNPPIAGTSSAGQTLDRRSRHTGTSRWDTESLCLPGPGTSLRPGSCGPRTGGTEGLTQQPQRGRVWSSESPATSALPRS